ncbi:hypothetical protein TRIUR3_31876 [Triticum urartu]|uniref:Uncharacterized protein n=1 Tax=Triticum urartu TaxID=4572 RepID=M8AGA5_TRIUA|nr:hypothetical protein TRIUR3_31876 [Triticum urartu]
MDDYNVNEFHDGPSTARTFVPLPLSRIRQDQVYDYAQRCNKFLFETSKYHYTDPRRSV